MGEQELIFGLEEMHLISVTCAGCGHGIIFDVRNRDTAVPTACPVCHADFGVIGEGLGYYRRFYIHMLEAAKHKTEFRIRTKI